MTDVLAAPVTHLGFADEIVIPGAQRRYLGVGVLVELVDDAVEVESAPPHRDVGSPIIRIPPVGDAAPDHGFFDEVRPARDRRFQPQLIERYLVAAGFLPPPG